MPSRSPRARLDGDADEASAKTLREIEVHLAYDDTSLATAFPTTSRASSSPSASASDVAQIKAAIAAFERGETSAALDVRSSLSDPAAVALLDWLAVRLASRQAGFSRIDAFYRGHRDWPMANWVRRRAEEALWLENVEPATVRAFFAANGKPERPEGKLAFARALLASGDRASAAIYARDAWRHDDARRATGSAGAVELRPVVLGG